MKDNRLLSKKEASEYLNVSVRQLDRMMMNREIPYYKLGDSKRAIVRFTYLDLNKWLQKFRNEIQLA